MASNDCSLTNDESNIVLEENSEIRSSNDGTNDEELNALLESALSDFNSQTEPKTVKDKSSSLEPKSESKASDSSDKSVVNDDPFARSVENDFKKLDQMFEPLINADPQLKEHWEKLTKSCADAANASNDEEFEHSLKETLKTISEKAHAVADDDSALSEEELAKIWANLGVSEGDDANGPFANLMPMMSNMMQNLLSKELLYPALKDLSEKYPFWLETHKDTLSADDLKRYTTQLELMRDVCGEFDNEKDDDTADMKTERFQRILSIMQRMQMCGSPPNDLIGDVSDFNSPIPDMGIPQIPGVPFGGGQNQCLIM